MKMRNVWPAAVLALACNADPSGGGTSFTSAGDSSTGPMDTTTTTSPPPDPATSSSSTSSADTTSTGSDSGSSGSSGDGVTTGGEPNMVDCMGVFPTQWQDGTDCANALPYEIHQYGYGTVIVRQALCTTANAPFFYMLFGQEQALLFDTGTGSNSVGVQVLNVVDQWLAATGLPDIELLVVNSHADGDHDGGNFQFDSTAFATIVGSSQAEIEAYFGFDDWPTQVVTHDLGGREIDIIPTPGHAAGHIAVYDHLTGVLLTADTLLPGRIFIEDFDTFATSIERLVVHTEIRDVCHILGGHIGMTNEAGVPYDFGAAVHANERELEMSRDHLLELHQAVQAMAESGIVVTETHDDFVIFPL